MPSVAPLTPSRDFTHQLSRHTVVVLIAAVMWGCDGTTDVGAIALSVTPASLTVQQGLSSEVAVTVTRSGGFTRVVYLNVTGAPAGIATNVVNLQTTGAVTTARVLIAVGAAVAPGIYNLTVRANGQGVPETLAMFALTVSPSPAVKLTLSDSVLTLARGDTTTTTVNLA